VLRDASLETSMHGLPSIIKTDHTVLKILWLAAFLAASGYCSYLIVLTIQSYLEYKVVTNIDTISEIPTKFPVSLSK
jgi:hypothetical protein